MSFGRIIVGPLTTKFNGQPYFEDTEILVADVLEMLAETDDGAVLDKYRNLTSDDINDALRFAAEVIRSRSWESRPGVIRSRTVSDEESFYFHLAANLALQFPRPDILYSLRDEEADEEIMQLTAFQLEYLKNSIDEPEDEDEGYFFTDDMQASIAFDLDQLENTLEAVEKRIEEIEKQREKDGHDENIDLDELARLAVRSELFEQKCDELVALDNTLVPRLGDYDAYEISWQALDESEAN